MGQTISSVIEVRDLYKKYPKQKKPAVNGISFQVEQGEIFGLLGPNGAGKTSTIKLLTSRMPLDKGKVKIFDLDMDDSPTKIRQHIGVVSQESNLDQSLNVFENLCFHGAYFGIPKKERREKATELLEKYGLLDKKKAKVDKLSGGMIRRLMIARALMHDPKVIFLDEPTAGLDPQSKRYLLEQLQMLKDNNITMVLTTHNMDEAEQLCDRVAIIDNGTILAIDTPNQLMKTISGNQVVQMDFGVRTEEDLGEIDRFKKHILGYEDVQLIEEIKSTHEENELKRRFRIMTKSNNQLILQVMEDMRRDFPGINLLQLTNLESTLEDVYIHYTGKELR
ncbi:ABC transporter ATP-binding protein [Ornithinibacillus halotolerans]|uniref:Daunorubicin resistance protein DrrA family ABC transporter ATP-binding protein n=1 Tax=Ornithinibacillus halotolerans TaxID=1274357 RepID=A0A916W481_9BACI|nr:ABC transporter ATP-binding protein [Ornithinibacillus halotolerans]GGA66147.1 daunorubicin resistance protein DrrA family ABC transporter ATP-binding protein [Ornithinibacillus halotolerans]